MLDPQDIKVCLQRIKDYTETDKTIKIGLIVSITEQALYVIENEKILCRYAVSTSKYGTGNRLGSYQTPLGVHTIAEKIGEGQPANMIFQSRQPTGNLASINNPENIDKDLITSRILWLTGCESGVNQGGEVDSYQRYIYIHGTANEKMIGTPASIGCIRMQNNDVISLFRQIAKDTPVIIIE